MSKWEEYELEEKILEILGSIKGHDEHHHLGTPYITPYQLAIIFERTYRDTFEALGMPLGGKDTGQHNSFAQYVAVELSRRIKNNSIPVEGAFLYRKELKELSYKYKKGSIKSSLGETYDLSMFRSK